MIYIFNCFATQKILVPQ